MNEKENTVSILKSGWQATWDNFMDFVREAFIKTPFETIFEVGLLVAGGSRTVNFLTGMGQSGFIATVALIYAEVGLVFMEFLGYRGKRVQYDYVDRKGKHYKAYPTFNQKSLAKIGLWCVHIPMTVFFTASDVIKSNLENLAKKSSVGFGAGGFDSGFAWVLGFVIAAAFFMDLVIIINYKSTNPETRHDEEMTQLEHDKMQWKLESEKIAAEAELEYARKNAKGLETARAKLKGRKNILEEFSGTFDKDYINSVLEDVEIPSNLKGVPDESKKEETKPQSDKSPRPYQQNGYWTKEAIAKRKAEKESQSKETPANFTEEGEILTEEEKLQMEKLRQN